MSASGGKRTVETDYFLSFERPLSGKADVRLLTQEGELHDTTGKRVRAPRALVVQGALPQRAFQVRIRD